MARLKLLVPLVVLLSPGMILVGLAQDQLTIDASKQPSPPATGRGPYSNTNGPGHFWQMPIRLELQIPSGSLQPDGTTLVDFVITNRGFDVIRLPSSTEEGDRLSSFVLNLWFTSDAVKDAYSEDTAPSRTVKIGMPSLSAELYGRSNDAQSFHWVAPNQNMKVHASSRVKLQPGTHTVTAHAELLRLVLRDSSVSWEVIGTADSETIIATFQQPTETGHADKTQRSANQQGSPDPTPQDEIKFRLLRMSDGATKSGARFGGKTFETTTTQTKLYLIIVHLDSREGAKKEYGEWFKMATRIIRQGKVQDKPATKPVLTEDRALVIFPATRECNELTTILRTAGTSLRIIQSCSSDAAREFERQANRNESENDKYVVR
jgi:hypothetical protein